MAKPVTLKKYPNRRLYDTESSSYVTLSHVAELIKQNRQVKVIDVKTNEDVTAFILTQIIMEEAKRNNPLLPVSVLHLIIRFGETMLSDFFERYLEKTIQSYIAYRKNMDEQFKRYIELGMNLSDLTQKTINEFSPFRAPSRNKDASDEKEDPEKDKD